MDPNEVATGGAAPLYAATLFLGAFLLFLLEPLYAKLILPWFGGSSSVWALCLVFYQVALLLGYAYADAVTRLLEPFPRALLHITFLILCLVFVRVAPDPVWRPGPGEDPLVALLGLKSVHIGLPFVLLSATSPLVQAWYAGRFPGRVPYRLFALSNAASLLALLAFPFLVEPNIGSKTQLSLWWWAFLLFAVLCAGAAWISRRAPVVRPAARRGSVPLPWGQRLLWVALAVCASMLLMTVTRHITQDVAPMPLLWVLPLALYLLSFILVFWKEAFYVRKVAFYALGTALVLLNYGFWDAGFPASLGAKVALTCGGLFAACYYLHGELALRKPSPEHLTGFYLLVSFGGALGALLTGIAAPLFFAGVLEFPLALLMAALLAWGIVWRTSHFHRALGAVLAGFLALVFALNYRALEEESLVRVRNFYGALRVVKGETPAKEKYLALSHGVVVHGKQFLDPLKALRGTAYYSERSGVGLALDSLKGPRKVGLVGLGVGTLAGFGRAGDHFRSYEINPQVQDLARSHFTYLSRSPAWVETVLGDARLVLESEAPQGYDLLAVDAFTGDAIPVHLLTREAFGLYARHLKPGGILAFHTSNPYLVLAPGVKLLAQERGWTALVVHNEEDELGLVDRSEWVLASEKEGLLGELRRQGVGLDIEVPLGLKPWSDDHNSLVPVLRR